MTLNVSVKSKARDLEGTVTETVHEAMEDAADTGFGVSQERVPSDTSMLMFSGVPPQWRSDGAIEWGYNAPHTRPVEYGSAPHYPPIEPLKNWARRVLGDEGAAYAVQQKIGKYGTPPRPFVRPGREAQRRYLAERGIGHRLGDNLPQFHEL